MVSAPTRRVRDHIFKEIFIRLEGGSCEFKMLDCISRTMTKKGNQLSRKKSCSPTDNPGYADAQRPVILHAPTDLLMNSFTRQNLRQSDLIYCL